MIYLLALFAGLLGGFCYRIRGGFIPTGETNYARAIAWATPCSGLTYSLLSVGPEVWWMNAIISFAVLVMAWVGLLIPHGRHQDMAVGQRLEDFYGMTLAGAERNLLLAAPFCWHYPWMWLLVPLGLLDGLAYLLSALFLQKARITWIRVKKSHPDTMPPARDDLDAKYSVAFQGYTDFAEFMVGFYRFAAFTLILLWSLA